MTPIMNARLRIFAKKRSGNQDLKKTNSNPGPHDHQPNTLTTTNCSCRIAGKMLAIYALTLLMYTVASPNPNESYQAFYGLKRYNLLETGSFLVRKLNQSTSYLMLQFKGKNTLELPFDSNFKLKIMCLVH